MPLNTLRLNAQASSHPNIRITFIKPLPLPTHPTTGDQANYTTAETFLQAIAAQCLPLMKDHYLSVTTLEEHEPNREFIGRNFNNGEIIQLVLKSHSGAWLPFNMVQMVMMHELAHNTHMNHSKKFWEVRNKYAGEMKLLWGRGYTGEGFWGSGRSLRDMHSVMGNNIVDSEVLKDLPVCGGTFRSRRRKRKAKEELTWKEKRDRRIEKKFGKNGVGLGEDEDKRMILEMGKKGASVAKPRVAQSNRGRELRAAAALARFDTNKKETVKEEIKEEDQSDSDAYEDVDAGLVDARDTNGTRLLDNKGSALVRVCGDDDDDREADNVQIKQEMEELEGLERFFTRLPSQQSTSNTQNPCTSTQRQDLDPDLPPSRSSRKTSPPQPTQTQEPHNPTSSALSDRPGKSIPNPSHTPPRPSNTQTCPICSLSNPSLLLTCAACANVLHPIRDKSHWTCSSLSCKEIGYVNAGDVPICGICGIRKV